MRQRMCYIIISYNELYLRKESELVLIALGTTRRKGFTMVKSEGKADSIAADSSTPETLTVRVDRLTPVN